MPMKWFGDPSGVMARDLMASTGMPTRRRVRGRALSMATLLAAMTGCSFDGLATFFASDTLGVAVIDGGGSTMDGGTTGYCEGPWVEVTSVPEMRAPWNGGPMSEFGMIRKLYDGGAVIREVVLSVNDGAWSARDTRTEMFVSILGRDGAYCGSRFDDAGQAHLRIEFVDGGVSEAPTSAGCRAYNSGWWAGWHEGRVLRGKGTQMEVLGDWDAGVIPGLIPSGIAPAVSAISEAGEVAFTISTGAPGGYLLPSGVRLEVPPERLYALPMGFVSTIAYGANAGIPAVPITWSSTGSFHLMDTGDESAHFFQLTQLSAHSDGHFCAGIQRTNNLPDTIAFWRRDGGLVSPEVFENGDAGMRALSDLKPAACWVVGPDWYLVYAHDPNGLPILVLVRVRLDCIP